MANYCHCDRSDLLAQVQTRLFLEASTCAVCATATHHVCDLDLVAQEDASSGGEVHKCLMKYIDFHILFTFSIHFVRLCEVYFRAFSKCLCAAGPRRAASQPREAPGAGARTPGGARAGSKQMRHTVTH